MGNKKRKAQLKTRLQLTVVKLPIVRKASMKMDMNLTGLIQTHLVALIDNSDCYFPEERYDILSDKRWF